jgi:hypothetical protein
MPEIFKVSWIRHSLNCLGFAVVGFGIPIGLARSNHLTGGALLFFALFLLLIVWGFFPKKMYKLSSGNGARRLDASS